mmetsp:Transcript_64442/g.119873  ORF Transcript_64442/g.119873 Transcript_64442/m.119873 type:complete len:785 (-) Transcript_64442:201-2555(-)
MEGDDPQAISSLVWLEELINLDFSVLILDPSEEETLIVACSAGFTHLTDYSSEDVVGHDIGLLLEGVPTELVDTDAEANLRAYLDKCRDVETLLEATSQGSLQPDNLRHLPWACVVQGEYLCVQVFAKKTGELFRCMVSLKFVELNEQPFIVVTHAPLLDAVVVSPTGVEQLEVSSPSQRKNKKKKKCGKPGRASRRTRKSSDDDSNSGSGAAGGGGSSEDGARAKKLRKERRRRRDKRDRRILQARKEMEEEEEEEADSSDRPTPNAAGSSSSINILRQPQPVEQLASPAGVPSSDDGLGPNDASPRRQQDAYSEDGLLATYESLGKNMLQLEGVLARHFWYASTMRRQGLKKTADGYGVPLMGAGLGGVVLGTRDPRDLLGDLSQGSPVPPDSGSQTHDSGNELSDGGNPWQREVSSDGVSQLSLPWHKQTSDMSQLSTACTDASACDADFSDFLPPENLSYAFDGDRVQPYPAQRYTLVKKLQEAQRNQGHVCLMQDLHDKSLVAVKSMPNNWVQTSDEAFMEAHPEETERPWVDIGCNAFLDSINYPYSTGLLAVYRDSVSTRVVTNFIAGGDLFDWASQVDVPPGPAREKLVKPLMRQLVEAVQMLHEKTIVHRDLSVENVLLTSKDLPRVKLIDFGAATTQRMMSDCAAGKPSYQAPEMFESATFDTFLCDAFALGVVLYTLCLRDYPWMDTCGRGDKSVQYIRTKGFRAFVERKKVGNSRVKVADCMSSELIQLLEGLLDFDPATRLSLGESVYSTSSCPDGRKSIWDEPWMSSISQ